MDYVHFFNKNDSSTGFARNFAKLFTGQLWTTASHNIFIERKTLFRTKSLRINASEIMVLNKKSRYLPHFL